MKKIKMCILIIVILFGSTVSMQAMMGRSTQVARIAQPTLRQRLSTRWSSGSWPQLQAARTTPVAPQAKGWGESFRAWWSGSSQPQASASILGVKPSPFIGPSGQKRSFSTSVVQRDEKLQDLIKKMQNVGAFTQEEQLANLKNRMNNQYAEVVSLISKNKLPSITQMQEFADLVKKSDGSVAADINKRYQNGNSLFRHLLHLTAQYERDRGIVNIFYELGGRCTKEDYEIIMNSLPNLKWFKETVNELGNKNYDDIKLSEVVKIADRLHSISRLLQDLRFPKDMYSTGKFNLWPLVGLPSRFLHSYQSLSTQLYEKTLKNKTIGNLKRGEAMATIVGPEGRVDSKDILKIFKEAGFVKENSEQALLAAQASEALSVTVDKGVMALPVSSFNDTHNTLYKNEVYQGPEYLYRKFMQEYAPDKLHSRLQSGEISQKDFDDMQRKIAELNSARSAKHDE